MTGGISYVEKRDDHYWYDRHVLGVTGFAVWEMKGRIP